jgi:CubicO group peptidase (beta-lactamase class C family)
MQNKDVQGLGRRTASLGLSLALIASVIAGCGASGAAPPATAPLAPGGEAAAAGGAAAPFAKPDNLAPERWLVLGPFVETGTSREAVLDHDYLAPLGGEASFRIQTSTTLDAGGKRLSAAELGLDEDGAVDFQAFYKDDTDRRVAYAYGEMEWPRKESVKVSFGSDDGASVWVNGQRVHRLVTPARGLNPDEDHFEMPLEAGTNRVLVKVENGSGGWGFALTVLDAEGEERTRALAERRHLEGLELAPESNDFLLEAEFPVLGYRRSEAARQVFGAAPPRVRWFDPDLREVQRPEKVGRYIAVIEQDTLDGYTQRSMLTFAKLPPGGLPLNVPTPPYAEPPTLRAEFFPGLSEAQRTELSRHVWRAVGDYFGRGENAAIARLGLLEAGAQPPPPGEPEWLSSGFIRDAERQLALRLQLEGRTPRPIPPPAALTPPAPVLRTGSEREAGIGPGTVQRLRGVAKDWLKEDPNGFVVMLARRGVVFMHEGFGGFEKEQGFRPASIGKLIAGLTFARAVDQGLVGFDDPVSSVFPEWKHERTAKVTFRHCFNHVAGLPGHVSHGGLYNPYLDNAFLVQDSAFVEPLRRHRYNGDSYNLSGKALELITGKTMWRLLYENVQKPFGEPVAQFDLGFGDRFTARYLAEVGQMLLQDGAYGNQRLYSPGFLAQLLPQRVAAHAPGFPDENLEWGIGQTWAPDSPDGTREKAVLGPNVFGHGAASGSIFRVDPDHQVVVVIGRNAHAGWAANERLAAKFIAALAEGLKEPKPAAPRAPQPVASLPSR